MITIYNTKSEKVKTLPDDTVEYFNALSAGELLEDHPEADKTQWGFVVFTPKSVIQLFEKMQEEYFMPSLKKAYDQELGLIEFCTGDFEKPTWVPLTPDLNIGLLKMAWYFDYCRKHGYTLKSTQKLPSLNDLLLSIGQLRKESSPATIHPLGYNGN